MDFLPKRGTGLLLRAAAPEQFGQPSAQRRTRRRQRDHRSSALVLRPCGSTFSLVSDQASICPINRSRTTTSPAASDDGARPGVGCRGPPSPPILRSVDVLAKPFGAHDCLPLLDRRLGEYAACVTMPVPVIPCQPIFRLSRAAGDDLFQRRQIGGFVRPGCVPASRAREAHPARSRPPDPPDRAMSPRGTERRGLGAAPRRAAPAHPE